jgi:hypothetical protein
MGDYWDIDLFGCCYVSLLLISDSGETRAQPDEQGTFTRIFEGANANQPLARSWISQAGNYVRLDRCCSMSLHPYQSQKKLTYSSVDMVLSLI